MKTSIIIAILSSLLFYGEFTGIISIGSVINTYFPCIQNPANSFPCFGIYDIYAMAITLIGIVISLMVLGYKLYKHKKSEEK